MARNPRATGRAPFSASTTNTSAKPKSKSKSKSRDTANAYTYLPSLPKRHRTSEQTLSLSREEAGPSRPTPSSRGKGKDPELDDDDEEEGEGDDMEERIRKMAVMIAGEDVGVVESEESDIDSDEAWEENGSDEERWGEVFRDLDRGKGKKKVKEVVRKPAKPFTVNLDESDDDGKVEKVKQRPNRGSTVEGAEEDDDSEDGNQSVEEEDDEEDDEEGEDDEDDDENHDSDVALPSDFSDDDEDPSTLEGLDAFVDQLASADKKRKGETESEAVVEKKKRRVLPVVSGPGLGDGNDLGLKSNTKLDLSALIASHPSLTSASSLLPAKSTKKSSSALKQGVLSAPLPTTVQERLDREAAYAKTREEGQKWAGVMKRVKEAEHLSFPLQSKDRGGVKSGGEMLAGFKPENKLESAVTALLNSANLTEGNMTQHEDQALQAQELSLEEIAARRAALQQQRELMFRAETRAKRVAKIKSKTFRKLARKREARAGAGQLSLEDLERLAPDVAEEEREKAERDRAMERATLRHGARSGRWAKDVRGNAGELEDRRKAKEEMLDIKEKLQRKISGRDVGDSSASSDEDDEEEESDDEAIKTRAFDQLASLDAKDNSAQGAGKNGLANMAFMKKAEEREMRKVAEGEADLRREIEMFGEEASDEDEGEEVDDEGRPLVTRVGGNEGRMLFSGPTPTSHDSSSTRLLPKPVKPIVPTAIASPRPPSPELFPTHNPWLATASSSGPSRKRNLAEAGNKTSKALAKARDAKGEAEDDERVEISVDEDAQAAKKRKAAGKSHGREESKGGSSVANGRESAGDEDGEDDLLPNGMVGFKQRDLVAEAFAGDNVVEDFAKDKERQIAADAPQTIDTSLPGWGSWAGKGLKRRQPSSHHIKTTPGLLPTSRKDFTRSNVIISEKTERKAQQFLAKDLPYPFTSVAQYQASFGNPVGGEWNSRMGVQRGTMPRVVKKPGAIIEPVQRLF